MFSKASRSLSLAKPEASTVEFTVKVASIDTRSDKRDSHLKSPDFFDVANFPTITFRSKRVESAGAGRLKVVGDLTIRGTTREVVLDVEGPVAPIKDQRGNLKSGASATAKINRKDFGMTWDKTLDNGGLIVGNEVQVRLDIECIKQQQ